eukprot:Skav226445  [mRNA]  locus=scaffold2660:386072:392731:- [translate_table: standard]
MVGRPSTVHAAGSRGALGAMSEACEDAATPENETTNEVSRDIAGIEADATVSAALDTTLEGGALPPVVSSGLAWSEEDEQQQQQAICAIEMLWKRADKDVAADFSWREAAKQQVMSLECELDGKEAALQATTGGWQRCRVEWWAAQVAETQLEERDAELEEAGDVANLSWRPGFRRI